MTDPIADLLTRIRNGLHARHESCSIPASKMKENVLKILKARGYIESFARNEKKPQDDLVIKLKYLDGNKIPAVRSIKRVSKPGRRVYRGYDDIKPLLGGLGVAIISTSKGVMADVDAKKSKLGGEVLCEVW